MPRDSVGKINDILIDYKSSGCDMSSHSSAGGEAESPCGRSPGEHLWEHQRSWAIIAANSKCPEW